jgi:hypothetical protein
MARQSLLSRVRMHPATNHRGPPENPGKPDFKLELLERLELPNGRIQAVCCALEPQ